MSKKTMQTRLWLVKKTTASRQVINSLNATSDFILIYFLDWSGYHLSLPMEIHGACYAKLQIVSKASLSRLKGVPRTIVTQNSFDIEAFSIHIANQ